MANKQTALRAKKDQKRKAASKQKQKQANINRNPEGASLVLKEERDMLKTSAREGLGAAMRKAHLSRKRKGVHKETGELTNKLIMQQINEVIPQIMRLHAGVEIFENLAKEKRFEITPEQAELIKGMDVQAVMAAEDIFAITQFIEADKKPDDYQDVYLHLVEVFTKITVDYQSALLTMFTTQKELIDAYAHEHRGSTPMGAYQQQLHELRMLRVAPLYMTRYEADQPSAVHSYTPDAPMPSDPVDLNPVAEPGLVNEQPQ